MNPTEERILNLLFTLYRNPSGLNLEQIKSKLSLYYENDNKESDQKKLSRDIEILNEIGFNVKFKRTNYQSLDKDVYVFERDLSQKKIDFAEIELKTLSALLLKNFANQSSLEIYTASQKIFKKNLEQFPFSYKKPKIDDDETEDKNILSDLLSAIQFKNPIKIDYYKNKKNEFKTIELDPISITKRSTEDIYLMAYDRKDNKVKRYLIPKILKIHNFNEEFIFNRKLNDEELNYHSLNFPNHDKEKLILEIDADQFWKLENFLFPHPFSIENKKLILETTNRESLFPFILKEPTAIKKINSSIFNEEFKIYKNKILEKYHVL